MPPGVDPNADPNAEFDLLTGEWVPAGQATPILAPTPAAPAPAAAPPATSYHVPPRYTSGGAPAPFEPQRGAGPPEEGVTAAQEAPTEVEAAGAAGQEITEDFLLDSHMRSPVGIRTIQRIQQLPAQGGVAGPEWEVSGKQLPPADDAKKLIQSGAAMQTAARYELLNRQADALSQQEGYLAQLQQEFGAFDDDAISEFEGLAAQQQRQIDEVNAMVAEARTRTVNPAAFYGNAGAGSAFAAGIATAVGAITSAYGGLDRNYAGDIIQNAVEANIRAQELDIQQGNFALGQAMNLLSQIRATTQSNIQARSVLRAMLYNQAELEFSRQAAVARREQIPGLKDQIAGQLKQAAGQALLDYNKEAALEYKVKGRGLAALNRVRGVQTAQRQAARRPRAGGGSTPKSSMASAELEQAQSVARAGQEAALQELRTKKYGGTSKEQEDAYRHQDAIRQATPILEEAFSIQERRGKSFSSAEAQQFLADNPLLASVVRSPEVLRADQYAGQDTIYSNESSFEFALEPWLVEFREKKSNEYRKLKAQAGRTAGIVENAEKLRGYAQEVGPVMLSLITKDEDGNWKLPAKNTAAYEKMIEIQMTMFQLVNAMRTYFEGGALHGPGEFTIFTKMAGIPTEWEKGILNMLTEVGPENFVSQLTASTRSVLRTGEGALKNAGFLGNETQFKSRYDFAKDFNQAPAP